jgi:hypothetical protein
MVIEALVGILTVEEGAATAQPLMTARKSSSGIIYNTPSFKPEAK